MGVVGREYNVQKGVVDRKLDVQKGVVDLQKIRCVEGCGVYEKGKVVYIFYCILGRARV